MAAGLSRGQADEVEAAGRARFRDLEQNIRPFPHVLATVTQLAARGVHLAIASSTPLTSEDLAAKLARLRLSEWFQTALSPRDLPRTANLLIRAHCDFL